ncbi:hypothetical protein M404DRAFT_1006312 [Pisolithus tinctorius Marx 270]|uniref:Uncharacterized protein n=1 Tax=Pisolithus tinctorius Marx 270 TaxID=870435 RepID=A0A0C3N7K7_PISTI|nr:hypothetical protein M404DRAFT_1006312 [Pisolithus tinctorius Marx 270]
MLRHPATGRFPGCRMASIGYTANPEFDWVPENLKDHVVHHDARCMKYCSLVLHPRSQMHIGKVRKGIKCILSLMYFMHPTLYPSAVGRQYTRRYLLAKLTCEHRAGSTVTSVLQYTPLDRRSRNTITLQTIPFRGQ